MTKEPITAAIGPNSEVIAEEYFHISNGGVTYQLIRDPVWKQGTTAQYAVKAVASSFGVAGPEASLPISSLSQALLIKGWLDKIIQAHSEGEMLWADDHGFEGFSKPKRGSGTATSAQRTIKSSGKGVYAACKISMESAKSIARWQQAAGIPNAVPVDKMHITTVYSRKPCDYKPHGKIDPAVVAKPSGFKLLGEDGKSLVLALNSPFLHDRWKQAIEYGASWDWPEYQPHVTLSYDVGDNFDVSSLQPFEDPLFVNEEYADDLDEDWKENNDLASVIAQRMAFAVKLGNTAKDRLLAASAGHINTAVTALRLDVVGVTEYMPGGLVRIHTTAAALPPEFNEVMRKARYKLVASQWDGVRSLRQLILKSVPPSLR